MTQHQREQRAMIIREQPLLAFFVVYAVAFCGCTLGFDLVSAWGATGLTGVDRYVFAGGLALAYWLRLRSWARRVPSGTRESPAK